MLYVIGIIFGAILLSPLLFLAVALHYGWEDPDA